MKPTSRPSFYLLIVLIAVVGTLTWYLSAPELNPKASQPEPPAAKASQSSASASSKPSMAQTAPPDASREIDPEIQRLADTLAERSESPERDVEIVREFISLFSKAFGGNPIGLNEDITAALTGQNAKQGILFPKTSPMIVNGQLVDRWGTPYWFHPESAARMEIRSAGPDKSLFTSDDVVMKR